MQNVLFVDDDENVLRGLERMLLAQRGRWDMTFSTRAEDALDIMQKKAFDVVVSDMRMPGMDGAAFLTKVKEQWPQTVRFVLTGYADDETALRTVDLAHRFLSKPCDPEEIISLIGQALSLRQLLGDEKLKKLTASLDSLPSLPALYHELQEELNSSDSSIKVVSKIIGKDVALSAKILHLVNSAFFGLRNNVTDLSQAASILGLSTIKSLVMMSDAFSQMEESELPGCFSLDSLATHSLAVGTCAREIAKEEGANRSDLDDAFAAGLLHDLGKLVLAVNRPCEFCGAVRLAHTEDISICEAETRTYGASHSQVGAYLLGLWGLPIRVVEAVAFHHEPSVYQARSLSIVSFVHVANYLVNDTSAVGSDSKGLALDDKHLMDVQATDRLPRWREVSQSLLGEAHA